MADMLITLNNTQDGFVSQPPGVTVKYDNELHGYLVSGLPEGGGTPPPDPGAPVNAQTPAILTQPQGGSFSQGAVVSPMTVGAVVFDGGTLSYQWYRNSSNSTVGGTAVGTNSSSYTPDTSVAGTNYYYCVVTNTITDNGDGGQKTASATSSMAQVVITTTQKIFGALWNMNSSLTTLTRTRNAQGHNFTPARAGVAGSSDFDAEPIYSGIKVCNVDTSGNITAYEGEGGFNRNPASGDVMVRIDKFYYDVINDSVNGTREFVISAQPFTNSKAAPAFRRPDGTERDYILVGAYTCDSGYRSRSGQTSVVNITRATARAGCRARGSGGTAGKYQQYDFLTYWTINLLYLVETADWDSQAAVGQGNVSGAGAQISTGATDGVGFHSGSSAAASATNTPVKYRGMENLWGNIYQWVDGINMTLNGGNQETWICRDPTQYADDVGDGANYVKLGYYRYGTSGVFQSALGFDGNHPFAQICTAGAGADGQYIPDRYYCSTSAGWRVLCVGGYWSNGAVAGLFYFSASSDASYSSTSIGARLLFLP